MGLNCRVDWLVANNVTEKPAVSIFSPAEQDNMLHRNVGFYQPICMAI
jgi:hypothetical protein